MPSIPTARCTTFPPTRRRSAWSSGTEPSTPTGKRSGPGNSATYTAGFEYGGNVQQITVTNRGNGYQSAPTVSLSAPGGAVATATAIATVAGGVVSSITVVCPGSLYASAPTVTITGGGGTGAAATASVNPISTYQATFNGSPSVTLPSQGLAASDPLPVTVFADTNAYSRTCVSVPAGGTWLMGLSATASDTIRVGSDATTSTGPLSSNTNSFQLAPVAILGYTGAGNSGVLIIGNSITAGYYDYTADLGYMVRALNDDFGYLQMSRPSSQIVQWSQPSNVAARSLLYPTCGTAWVLLGTNDFSKTTTVDQMEQGYTTIVNQLTGDGLTVYGATIPPLTASTDGWRTTANQSTYSQEPKREGFNSWIRTLPAGLTGITDFADALESSPGSGLWKTPTATYASGTLTSGTAYTVTDSTKNWASNIYLGDVLTLTAGTGAGQSRTIQSCSGNTLAVSHYFSPIPDSTSKYVIDNGYTVDGTHPSGYAHQLMAQMVNPQSLFNAHAASTSLSASNASAQAGSGVVLSATLTQLNPVGPLANQVLTFSVDGTIIGSALTNAGGTASATYNVPSGTTSGAHSVTAAFSATAGYQACSASATLTVTAAIPTAIAVANVSGAAGQTVSLSATLTRSDTRAPLQGKSLSFLLNGMALRAVTTRSSGKARFSYTIPFGTATGVQTITVSFAGDANDSASSGTGTLTTH